MPQTERPHESLTEIRSELPEFRRPSPASYLEWSGNLLMVILLVVICLFTAAFLALWAWTQPSLSDVAALLKSNPSSADPSSAQTVLETWIQLRREHSERFREMFQLLVASGLIPLFTLLAGYVFGKGQAGSKPESGDGSPAGEAE